MKYLAQGNAMKMVIFEIISIVVSHHMLQLLSAGECNLWWHGDPQEATRLLSETMCGIVHWAPGNPWPKRQHTPHLPYWKAMRARKCWEVCWARATSEGGAVPFGMCRILCFGSLFWPFGSLLLPWPLERNSVTEGSWNRLREQEDDLKGEWGP